MGATIQVNGTPTREITVPFGAIVSLTNGAPTGSAQVWTLLDYPEYIDGTHGDFATNFSAWTVNGDGTLQVSQTPAYSAVTFKPDVTGSYLIRLVSTEVGGAVSQTVVIRVPDVYSGEHMPAAGESDEAGGRTGWKLPQNKKEKKLARFLQGCIKIANVSGGTLNRGRVGKISGTIDAHTITPNVNPGGSAVVAEYLPTAVLADPTASQAQRGLFAVFEETIANNATGWARIHGVFKGLSDVNYTGYTVGERAFFSSSGVQSATAPASVAVPIGTVLTAGSNGEIFVDGNMGAAVANEAVANLTALRTRAPLAASDHIYLQGFSSIGDGGQGRFYWDAASTATVVAGMVEQVTGTTTGRWVREVSDKTRVRAAWFGAKFDNTTNDAPAVAAARDWLNGLGGGTIFLEQGTTLWTAQVAFGSNITLRGAGLTATTIRLQIDSTHDGVVWNVGSQYGFGGGLYDLKIHVNSFSQIRDAVSVQSWYGWNSRNVTIEGAGRYGCLMSDGIETTVYDMTCDTNHDSGLWLGTLIGSVATSTRFVGCRFTNSTNGPGAIVDSGIGLSFVSCIFESSGSGVFTNGHGILINSGTVSLHSCYFENNAMYDVVAGAVDETFLHVSNPTIVPGGYKTHGVAGIHGMAHLHGGGWFGGDISNGGLAQSLTLDSGSYNFAFIGVKLGSDSQIPTFNGGSITGYSGLIHYIQPSTGTPFVSGFQAVAGDLTIASTLATSGGKVGVGILSGMARKLHVRGGANNDGIQVDVPAGAGNRALVIIGPQGHGNAGVAGVQNATNDGTHLDLMSGVDSGGAGRGVRLKDTGSVIVGSGANPALPTNAVAGFLFITCSDGPPTGTITIEPGYAALHFDRVANVLYINDGGGWVGGTSPGVWT